jgi:hypothetical protein
LRGCEGVAFQARVGSSLEGKRWMCESMMGIWEAKVVVVVVGVLV